jgi:hypothetical protein
MKKLLFAMMAIVLLISACSKEAAIKPKPVVSAPKIKVGESYAAGSGIKVTMYQDTAFLTQYNRVYLVLTDSVSGAAISTASTSIAANMTGTGGMMGMPMTCPVVNPVYSSSSSIYVGAVVFNMANSSSMGQWDLTVSVTNQTTGKMGNADFMVAVNSAKYNLTTSVTGIDGQTYVISLVHPLKPYVGMNTLELMVDEQMMVMNMTGMDMSYMPVNNFTVAFTPSMAAMGNMPSNDNVTPAFLADGTYVGKVNLPMAGEWKLNIDLMNGQTTVVKGATLDFKF